MKRLKATWKRLDFFMFFFLFPLIIFAGCAKKVAINSAAEDQILEQRVKVYWEHKIKGEFDKSYEYEDPFFRKSMNMVTYIKTTGRAVKWKQMSIERITVDNETAQADLVLTIQAIVPDPKIMGKDLMTREEDRWVKVDGTWYHSEKRRGLKK